MTLALRGRAWGAAALVLAFASSPHAQANEATIAEVKPSVVAIGTYERTRTPPFQFLGTGFAVGDGSLIATNAHVLPGLLDPARRQTLAILQSAAPRDGREQVQAREVKRVGLDVGHDLAVLKLEGEPLPALVLANSDGVREGQSVLFTGFPIGSVLGPFPATHRAMVAAITPIAIPQCRAADLDAATAKRITTGAFPVFQLDGTAYPGNSGSPVYDAGTGAVIGVLNMVLVKSTKEALLAQPSGIAYAVPIVHLRVLLETIR
jgi:S1-C subfamily serine protease